MKVWKFHHVYSPKAWIMPKVKAEVMELHATIWMKRINVILWFKKRLQRIKRVWLILSRSIEKKWARAKVDIEERKHLHRRHKKFLLIIKNKAIPKLRKLLKKLKIVKIMKINNLMKNWPIYKRTKPCKNKKRSKKKKNTQKMKKKRAAHKMTANMMKKRSATNVVKNMYSKR